MGYSTVKTNVSCILYRDEEGLLNMKDKKDIVCLMKQMRLSQSEVEQAFQFINKHRTCTTPCRSIGQTQYTIAFHTCSLGSWVTIDCGKCHNKMNISDEVRLNW